MVILNRHEVDGLDALMPGFGLTGHVRSLGVTTPTVSIDNPPFFVALEATLAETDLGTIRDYLRWHLVRSFASALPPVFEQEGFEFYGRTLTGRQEQLPRWRRIIDAASADIGEQVARVYVEEAFPPAAKARCEAMVGHLLSAMGRAIRNTAWMSEPTREEALAKLATFGWKIGYPSAWRHHCRRGDLGAGLSRAQADRVFIRTHSLSALGGGEGRVRWGNHRASPPHPPSLRVGSLPLPPMGGEGCCVISSRTRGSRRARRSGGTLCRPGMVAITLVQSYSPCNSAGVLT